MSYATQSQLAVDVDFISRCSACAAQEIYALTPGSPTSGPAWTQLHNWDLAATPGFDAAYESALVAGLARPGWDAAVITDGQILASVQALLVSFPPEPAPT